MGLANPVLIPSYTMKAEANQALSTCIYESERDLGLVAEILRHKSIETAQKHPHPTTEMKKDVVEAIQGGAGK